MKTGVNGPQQKENEELLSPQKSRTSTITTIQLMTEV